MPHFVLADKVEKRYGLNCIYTNADILTNKMTELIKMIEHDNIDIIGIVETLPKNLNKDTHPDDIHFVIKGFNTIKNNKGRGLCLFVKEGLDVIRLPEIEHIFETSIFCKIKTKSESFTAGIVYRSPSSNELNEKLFDQINQISAQLKHVNDNLLIMGDFNFPEIDWDSETCGGEEGNRGNKFLSTIHHNYLFQHVHDFTHFKPNTKPSLLDLIFTNQPEFVNSVKCYAPVGCSHHRVLNIHIQNRNPRM